MSEKSVKYETVRRFWELGMWDERKLRDAVSRGWITEGEYEELVG